MGFTLLLIVTQMCGQKIINCRSQNIIQQSKTTRRWVWHKFTVSVLLFCINHFNGNLQQATDTFWSEKSAACLFFIMDSFMEFGNICILVNVLGGFLPSVVSTGDICHMPAVQKTDIPPKTFWRLTLTVW